MGHETRRTVGVAPGLMGLVLLAAAGGGVAGQEPLELTRLPGPVELDGRSDEAAWEEVEPLPMTMYWPDFGGEMTERTEIRIAYDDEHLYAAGRFYDSEPSRIRANSLYRDRWDGDDTFDLVVDSYNDDQTALRFTTTPLGIRMDDEVRNDAEPGGGIQPLNREWDAPWETAVDVTDDGWFAEMKIPFSTLGFEAEGDRVVMGIIAGRWISRKNEKHVHPAIPPEWSLGDFKPSRARDVSLRDVSSSPRLDVAPYLLTGLERTRDLDREGTVPAPPTEATRELGLDVKVGLSPNLTLDLTVNTDFAQVESDAEQVNLTRFDLFLPEKRQFFQERSAVFQFNTGDEGRLFHSRSIGLTDEGEPMSILGGVRLAGRVGAWDVGLLDMQVEGTEGVPGENAGVLRVRRSFGEGGSSAGLLAATRFADGGSRSVDVGMDGEVHVFGRDHLLVQWAHTVDGGGSIGDRSLLRAYWERRATDGVGYHVDVLRSGPAYEPGLGFETRDDYTALKGRLSYGFGSPGIPTVSRFTGYLTSRLYVRNGDGSVESALQRLRWSTEFRNGHYLNLALNLVYEDLDEPLAFDEDVRVPPGGYFGPDVFAFFALDRSQPLNGSSILHVGRFLDGWRGRLELRPSWIVSPHLSLSVEYGLNRLWFPDRGQAFAADVARLRVRAALDTKLSAQAFLQYSRSADRLATNARLRYHFAEGRDVYLVYDETRDLGPLAEDLTLAGSTDRRLLLKYSYTLRP